VILAKAAPRILASRNETLILSTGPGDDRIDPSGGNDIGAQMKSGFVLYAGAGDDVASGGLGDDQLHGGMGDDLFRTASSADGADLYDGGRDEDRLTYAGRTSAILISADSIANDGEVDEHDDVRDTIEALVGGDGDDEITGGNADNILVGGPGNDTLNGGNGDDDFIEPSVSEGTDIMNGGAGVDLVDYAERKNDLVVTLCIPAVESCSAGASTTS
jgi:Ca2+-binding RTX toxin-like protein